MTNNMFKGVLAGLLLHVTSAAIASNWSVPPVPAPINNNVPANWTAPAIKPSYALIAVGEISILVPLFKKDDNGLAGIDEDADGIRDDVQAAIDQHYSQDTYARNYLMGIRRINPISASSARYSPSPQTVFSATFDEIL